MIKIVDGDRELVYLQHGMNYVWLYKTIREPLYGLIEWYPAKRECVRMCGERAKGDEIRMYVKWWMDTEHAYTTWVSRRFNMLIAFLCAISTNLLYINTTIIINKQSIISQKNEKKEMDYFVFGAASNRLTTSRFLLHIVSVLVIIIVFDVS